MRWVLALILGGMMATGVFAQTHKGYEMPPYKVELSDGAFELRSYGAHLVAEVTVEGSRDAATGTGFRMLAGYIFGGNEGSQKIAMTVPVAQSPEGAGRWTIRFMMPADKRREGLPVPKDDRIRFVEMAPERQVAVQFKGLRTAAVLDAKEAELRAWAKAKGLTLGAGPHLYFYDGPMTLPWNRRNEVAFTLR